MRAVANKKLPTIVVLDPARTLEIKWWSLQGMPVAVTFFTSSAEESINLAASYGVDLLVIQLPVDGLSVGDLIRVVRRLNSAVRIAVVVGPDAMPGGAEIHGAEADFFATESLDFAVLASVFKRLIAEARGGAGSIPRTTGTAA
ncbi:MAG: hypothetical protein HYY84_13695 [Deltaproteobacteria bacterium]|nr:hypothetical protein [Deltaproteobacteria bacterium]